MIFVTHGHKFNTANPPMLKDGDVLVHGHTHIQAIDAVKSETATYTYINPGSVSIPKNGNSHSYMIYENGVFTIKDLDGNTVKSFDIR
jgi:putative phosphoesterase